VTDTLSTKVPNLPCRIFAFMMLTAQAGGLVQIILLGAELTQPRWPA